MLTFFVVLLFFRIHGMNEMTFRKVNIITIISPIHLSNHCHFDLWMFRNNRSFNEKTSKNNLEQPP